MHTHTHTRTSMLTQTHTHTHTHTHTPYAHTHTHDIRTYTQEGYEDDGVVPLRVMPLKGVGHTFTILKRPAGTLPVGELSNILRFTVKEIDPGTGACV